nr:MAG TPA: chromosome segregation ATPase [Bacteriophage sp.]
MIIKIIFCFFVIHNNPPFFCFYYIRQLINTQLKTVGESVSVISKLEEALKEIDNIGTVGMPRMAQVNRLLKETFADCSIEAAKMAISQSTLNKEQIELILSSKGLTGNILETTTAELANATATNAVAVAEGTATTATVGFGTAIKGLGASLKSLVAAHPVLLAITAAIGAIYATVKIVDACTTSFDELKDKISNLKQDVSDSESTLKDYKTQLDEINQKITEINNQDSLSFTDEQELENLKNQKTELENMYNIEKARHDLKQKELEDTANKYFNKKITPSLSKEYKDYSVVDEDGFEKKLTKLDIMNLAKERMLLNQSRLDTLNEEYNNKSNPSNKETKEYEKKKAQLEKTRDDAKKTALDIQEEAKEQVEGLDSTSDTYKKVTEASQELSDALARLNNDWDSLSDKGKREDLSSKISKEAKNLSSDDMKNIDNYLSTLSDDDLNILANVTFDENTTVESLKEVIKAAQEEANKSSVDLPVKTFDPTSLLEESDDKTKTATLADLQSEADLLSSIQKEMSETGRIGVDSMQKIIKQYPEAKDALGQYMLGIISQEELFDQLQGVYEDDKNAYIYSLVEKSKYDGTFYSNLVNTNNDFFAGLSEAYGEDFSNYKNLAQAKQKIDDQLIKYLSGMWGKFYQTTIDTATGLMSLTSKATSMDDDMDLGLYLYDNGADEETNAIAEMQKMVDDYNALQNISFESAFNGIDLSWQGFSGDDSSSSNDSSSSQTEQDVDWIERLINKISTAYSRLKNVVSDTTTTWLNRNNALSDSMSTLADEINAQSDAYEYYMNAFNSYGLDDYYKNQIADGSISIDVIYDDDLKNAISDCQDFYDKAQDAKTAVQELNIELKGLAKSRFDNVASEFEKKISYFKDYSDQLQKEMDIITTKGWFSSTSINEGMKKVEQDNLDRLKQERNALMNALNSAVGSGKIEKYSEDWYDMQSSIDSVTSSILDAEKALIEYDNAIRQIKWDAFDRTRDDVENLISETEFLVELLKDKGITDDNGNTTAEGKAAQALLVQKYQLYLNQAQKYKDEILKIDEELVNNPYDKELLDRKQDLIDKQQEAIKSSISEKDAIKDLVNDGYNDLLDALQKVIDKQKESLSAEKSLHDYQKTVAEQANTVAQLQKRLLALQGDNSESGQSKKQSISSELKDAQDQLEETEYEQYIEDQTKMLDDLATQAEEWINTRLDNLDGLIQQIIDDSNTHSGEIKDTITNTANEFGINLSDGMKSIWETNTNNINNNITSVFNDFGTKFDNTMTTLNNVVSGIESKVQEMLSLANEEAAQRQAELEEQRRQQEAAESNSSSSDDYSEPDYDWDDIGGGDSDSSSGGDGVDWIYSPDYFPKDQLNVNASIVDRLKSLDYDSSFGARAMYFEQMGLGNDYTGSYDDNVAMLEWMKSRGIGGYRKGTKSATKGLHIYGEDNPGSEVLVTKYGVLRQFDSGDTVFNKDQVEKLWNLSKGITTPNMYMDNLGAKLPNITPVSTNKSVDIGGINVNVDKVVTDNPEDFTRQLTNELAGNSKIQKILGEINSNQLLGRNSLSTRRYMK